MFWLCAVAGKVAGNAALLTAGIAAKDKPKLIAAAVRKKFFLFIIQSILSRISYQLTVNAVLEETQCVEIMLVGIRFNFTDDYDHRLCAKVPMTGSEYPLFYIYLHVP
ncbi:hypothetical protein BML2526_04790 [Providencia rettgeri]|nr:hypothetical protein BML2526_04790 [Providencia rettgeri]BBV13796.1 hypothetical protein BML2576_32550 [Providencia rettgeri]BDH19900.1 hypothetical protein PrNR1418_31910 [Providencia rettgeri]